MAGCTSITKSCAEHNDSANSGMNAPVPKYHLETSALAGDAIGYTPAQSPMAWSAAAIRPTPKTSRRRRWMIHYREPPSLFRRDGTPLAIAVSTSAHPTAKESHVYGTSTPQD